MTDSALSGTKELIFETAIEMFSSEGYENVSMREIAKRCNIKASSIYNHFPGKQDILNGIYQNLTDHYHKILLSRAALEEIARSGSREEFVDSLFPSYDRLSEPLYRQLILTTKIVYMRLFNDPQASRLFAEMGAHDYLRRHLEFSVKIGRIKPLDVDAYIELITGYRTYMGMQAFVDPEYKVGQLETETRIKAMLGDMLPFLY